MKALVFYDVKDIRYEENWPVPPPPPPGFVKIKIDWCGICGTDIEDYLYGGVIPVHEPHPQSGCVAPIVIGHEFSGTVYETGRDVRNVAVGDKVAVECVVGCGTCYWCKLRDFGRCEQYLSIGQHCDGGFAEYVNVPAENCIVYSGVGADEIAVAEPLAVCVRALKKGRIKIGDSVAVVGAGPIGLCSIAVAKVAGASRVICIARGGHRAEVAVQMGADVVLNSREEGWEEQYWRETGGLGSDLVVDTGGNIPAMQLAYRLTKRGERCVFTSVANGDIPINALNIILDEKEILGTVAHSYEREFAWAMKYICDGRVDVKPMITGRLPLKDALTQGIHRLIEDRNQIKVLVTPNEKLLEEFRNE